MFGLEHKVGCVFSMIVASHAEFGRNDHREENIFRDHFWHQTLASKFNSVEVQDSAKHKSATLRHNQLQNWLLKHEHRCFEPNVCSRRMTHSSKVGCVFPMVVVSIHGEFGRNDHQQDVTHFSATKQKLRWIFFLMKISFVFFSQNW